MNGQARERLFGWEHAFDHRLENGPQVIAFACEMIARSRERIREFIDRICERADFVALANA